MKRAPDSVIRLSDLKRFVPTDEWQRGRFFVRVMKELGTILTELSSTGWTDERKAWIRQQSRKNQRCPARRVAFRILAGHIPRMTSHQLLAECVSSDFEPFILVSSTLMVRDLPERLRTSIVERFTWPTRDTEGWRYISLYMSLVALHFASNTELGVDTDRLRWSQVLREIQSVQWKLEKNNIADAIDILSLMKRSLHLFPPVI